ncbi:transcription antitermination factor NusB [Rhabdochromatium marinum]|uniref:transcription antitermination factor NusB n=1 Tax=Rhabdochromatium marinum TaxID=48729 RepID=UPI001906912D|nr:transcription antitermination factor NusB [Rhabdochromatium marinum]MBK1650438.1 transcription antitermination factor NusB [Rhabdochromatium marinum]
MAGPRSLARRYALLALYQWQLGRHSAAEIAQHFYDDPLWMDALARGLAHRADDDPLPENAHYDLQLFDELLRGVTEQVEALDECLKPFLSRSPTSIDPVERAILRLATFELWHSPQLPAAVILDEAIDLAKTFGAEQGHRFVNGVLDKLAQHRPSNGF